MTDKTEEATSANEDRGNGQMQRGVMGHTFFHRKTGSPVKVLNEPAGHWDFVELLYVNSGRKGRKRKHYFDYDYLKTAP
jgi:hypothetical protein